MSEHGDSPRDAAIHRAPPERAAQLSALTIRSLAYWGYSPEQLRIFERELRLSPRDLESGAAGQLELAGSILGFYLLVPHDCDTVELERLFVEPSWLRRGVGSRLLEHACDTARDWGFERVTILANPHAEGFYRARGAVRIGEGPSSLPGRSLPLLELTLGRVPPGGAKNRERTPPAASPRRPGPSRSA